MPKSTAPKRRTSRRSPPEISAVEKTAVRIIRKLYEATGGQPQRWESLGNLGAEGGSGLTHLADRAGIQT
jgi:Flp pilus assembly CpaE family ATPase